MIFRRHIPAEPLARFIEFFWFYEDLYPNHSREHVLPDGTFELIIDLRETPRKLFDREDWNRFTPFRRGWLSGAHSEYIIIDALPASSMIGAHFRPGGAAAVLGLPANEMCDQVVELDAFWGDDAWDLREQLLAARGSDAKFHLLEKFLLSRLRRNKTNEASQRKISWALERFSADPHALTIRSAAHQLGVSHKHFIEQFRRQVGLTPKLFCRVQRFQHVLSRINSRQMVEWADVACACGYFDQAHFANDFRAFSGLNPTAYLSHNVEYPNFVPVDD